MWIFAPAAYANMSPVIANNLPFLKGFNTPLDFGKTFRGKRVFGDNKTYRGILSGVVMAIIIVTIEIILARSFSWPSQISQGIDYTSFATLSLGVALGLGAGLGDAVESFFKRQAEIKPGDNWVPFDQIDFMLGAFILSFPLLTLPLSVYLATFIATLLLHPTFNIISWLFGLQDRPF
jgi:CDP-2,3-bis-(O-geranylgeranyl)-sn-glycerol synthase